MGLASALSTALTGMSAAETSINVVGNNLANSSTVGFKASTATFATQFSQTLSLGSAASANNAGTDPEQIGLGTLVAQITQNFSQGTISTVSTTSDMAIQGNGFFVMQGGTAGQLYTRDGEFTTNADNALVNSAGYNLLGYGTDGAGNINTSALQPMTIPLGTSTVASATQNVSLEGSLTSSGTIANTATILETNPLGDAQYPWPQTAATAVNDGNAGSVPGGTYTYYVTYSNTAGTVESCPSPLSIPISVPDNSEIQVSFTNTPTTAWDNVNIYRCDSKDPNTYHLVDTVVGGAGEKTISFTDDLTDAQVDAGQTLQSMTGPPITTATLLTNLISADGNGEYSQLFSGPGSLAFTGNVGNTNLTTKNFQVTDTSTVGDLMTFMQQAMGIQSSSADPTNPIPPDSGSGLYPGTYIANSEIEIVGNNGTGNALSIPLSALQFTPTSDPTASQSVNMPFNTAQQAAGESVSTSVVVYDSLGTPLSVQLTAVLQDTTSSYTEYRWFADCGQNSPASGAGIAVGTGLIRFGSTGDYLSSTNDTVSIDRDDSPAVKPLQFALDFSSLSGLATNTPSLSVSSQDGCAPGNVVELPDRLQRSHHRRIQQRHHAPAGRNRAGQLRQPERSGTAGHEHVQRRRQFRPAGDQCPRQRQCRHDPERGRGTVQRRREHQPRRPDHGLEHV